MANNGLTVALAGNPNSGKTTIFNNITGARQHVGNYPGVTVEKREGVCRFQGTEMLVIDLPGTYSLTAHAIDELVARNVIIEDRPDIIVNILDASNLERNLYLAVQFLELERPMVLALNMTDVAQKMGQKVNDKTLTRLLGVPLVHTIGNRNQGTAELLETVVAVASQGQQQSFRLDYGPEIEGKIKEIVTALADLAEVKYPPRWLALKILENDQEVKKSVGILPGGVKILTLADKARAELKQVFGEELELVIAEKRYAFVSQVYRESSVSRSDLKQTTSDKIDKILTNRVLGLPIFLAIMWLLFNMVFSVGQYPQNWLQDGTDLLGAWIGQHMAAGDLKSLVVDGIIGGVGTVLSFLPQILLLFFGIALLEDTGYMARAAFVMDRAMRAVGLHGKSFIPLLLGFGCNIPSIMGTRTLENPRDRMVTILVSPLISCSARLPVYTLLTAAFFSESNAGTVMFSLYLLGILLAIIMAYIFRKFLFPGAIEPFAMEMPFYHIPTLRGILIHMWERGALYLKKAGTIILAVAILVWFFFAYPSEVSYSRDYDQAKATVAETFSLKMTNEVLTPLNLEKLEDNADLQALVDQITELKSQDEESADQAEIAHPAADALNPENPGAESEPDGKLAELEKTQSGMYPYAMRYWELGQEQKAEEDKLDKEQAAEKLSNSYAGRFGQLIEPVIKPLGFDWKMGVSLVAGFAAKEVVVSTMGTIYSVGEVEDDTQALQDTLAADPAFTPLIAYTFMVFVLLYTPCMAAMAVVRRETNSWKWTAFAVGYSMALAWIVSFGVYQVGRLLGY